MSATLSAGCICGKAITVPCPTLHDLPRGMGATEDVGLIWFPSVGYACSPACVLVSASEAAMRQQRACAWPMDAASERASLFAEAAE